MNSIYRQVEHSGMAAIVCTMLAAVVILAGTAIPAQAQTETLLHQFTGSPDGAWPDSGLVLRGGSLYGTTSSGGNGAGYGDGVVYKMTTKGKERILYTFAGQPDGAYPDGGVVFDKQGNLYGTTVSGGTYNCGTIYEIAENGTESVLHSFDGSDGCSPGGSLAFDKSGDMYSTTGSGGTNGVGTVFKLAPDGTFTTLHIFANSDGQQPYSGVVLDRKGNLYGTTAFGGAYGNGVVYEVTLSSVFSVLYSFTGGTDGSRPASPPVFDKKGNLYGTTTQGGAKGGGTVYEIASKTSKETVLHSFTGVDGWDPWAGALVFDNSGNLYGTTDGGGDGQGTVFKLAPDGTETVLYRFDNQPDGMAPQGNVTLDAKGNLYTTAWFGGNGNGLLGYGTIIKVTP